MLGGGSDGFGALSDLGGGYGAVAVVGRRRFPAAARVLAPGGPRGRDLGENVPGSVNKTALPERGGVDLLDRADQARGAVADDQQRAGQAAVAQVGKEVLPGVEGLAGAGAQADEGGLAFGGDAPGGQDRLGPGAGGHPGEAGVP